MLARVLASAVRRMTKAVWKAVGQKDSLRERIAAEVEAVIQRSRLQPGDRLPPERDLATLLRVSRPSLREAVKVLEGRGRLSVKHGQGVFVSRPPASLDASEALRSIGLRELFAMREVLEGPAAEWAAGAATSSDVAELHAILRRLDTEAQRAQPDYERLRQLDIAFHVRIAAMSRNRFLGKTMQVLHEMIASSMQTTLTIPGRLARARGEHRAIADAIAAHSGADARRAMLTHIRRAQTAGLARLDAERPGARATVVS